MNDHYAYLVGALIYDAAWVACYFWCRSYRAQMIWGSLVSAPFALTSILFIPQYWSPPSLFNLDARFKVGIEDFLWAAAVGGIASVIGEAFLKERFAARRGQKRQRHFAAVRCYGRAFLILEFWHPGQTMYNMIFALLVGAPRCNHHPPGLDALDARRLGTFHGTVLGVVPVFLGVLP